MINVPEKYQKIWGKAVPYLKDCRKGELEHCQNIAEEVYKNATGKKWDLDVLIPLAILHDVGHAAVLPQHFYLISGPKKEENSKLVHMLTGAKIAHDILTEIDWPEAKVKEIVDIISIHDNKDKTLLDTEEKKVFNDIDKLDRYRIDGYELTKKEFGVDDKQAYVMLTKFLDQIVLPENRKIAEDSLELLKKKYKI